MPPLNRFLVVVRAGDASLHPQWTCSPGARNWDLVVSYFGEDPHRFRNDGERREDDKGAKWAGLHALLSRDDFWRRYDYVWFPDDDLAADQDAVNNLFNKASSFGLKLAQPSLSWASFYSHQVTIRHPSFSVRMTDFVEIMAPCFERSFLEACLPTFLENLSGWGLDFLWPRLLPSGSTCGIIDDVEVTHTRPIGGPSYERLRRAGVTPQAEMDNLMSKYAIPPNTRPRVLKAIDGRSNLLDGSLAEDAGRMRELLALDWAAFNAATQRAPQNTKDAGSAPSTR